MPMENQIQEEWFQIDFLPEEANEDNTVDSYYTPQWQTDVCLSETSSNAGEKEIRALRLQFQKLCC